MTCAHHVDTDQRPQLTTLIFCRFRACIPANPFVALIPNYLKRGRPRDRGPCALCPSCLVICLNGRYHAAPCPTKPMQPSLILSQLEAESGPDRPKRSKHGIALRSNSGMIAEDAPNSALGDEPVDVAMVSTSSVAPDSHLTKYLSSRSPSRPRSRKLSTQIRGCRVMRL